MKTRKTRFQIGDLVIFNDFGSHWDGDIGIVLETSTDYNTYFWVSDGFGTTKVDERTKLLYSPMNEK